MGASQKSKLFLTAEYSLKLDNRLDTENVNDETLDIYIYVDKLETIHSTCENIHKLVTQEQHNIATTISGMSQEPQLSGDDRQPMQPSVVAKEHAPPAEPQKPVDLVTPQNNIEEEHQISLDAEEQTDSSLSNSADYNHKKKHRHQQKATPTHKRKRHKQDRYSRAASIPPSPNRRRTH